MKNNNISVGQIKAARALLDWTQGEFAERSGIPLPTVKRLEKADVTAPFSGSADTLSKAREAMAKEGIEFLGGDPTEGTGVLLKP